jgi:adenylate cyclase
VAVSRPLAQLLEWAARDGPCSDILRRRSGCTSTLDAYMRLDPYYPEIALQFLAGECFSLGEFRQAIAALEQRLARNPQSDTAYALLASCYGRLGQSTDCRTAWGQAIRINPGLSIDRRRRVLPFRNPEDFERRVEGLRKAGLTALAH